MRKSFCDKCGVEITCIYRVAAHDNSGNIGEVELCNKCFGRLDIPMHKEIMLGD